MKILFLSHRFYPDIGGIEVNSEILADAFHKAGHEVHLLTWTEEAGNRMFPYTVVRVPSVTALLRQHQWADVVFENNPCLRMSWPGLLIKRPLVIALRTWINRMDGGTNWQDRFKLNWLKRAKQIIAVSNAVRDRYWPSAIVIGNPYRQKLFRELKDINRELDFVYLGRLVSDKGVDLAIKALHQIINSGQSKDLSLKLTIIGDGPERLLLENLVEKTNLSANVKFTGSLNGKELVRELNKHKYLIVPSKWEEPFGNVALEGLACGCLPIVSNGGGLPDAVGHAGLIFERGNEISLVRVIRDLLENPELEDRLKSNAEFHLQNHQPDKISKRYLQVIESIHRSKK